MKYAVEMGSGARIYIPGFIKNGSGIQKLIGGIHRQQGDLTSLLLYFQNKESRLKTTIEEHEDGSTIFTECQPVDREMQFKWAHFRK
jgi:hypothetical protein